EALDLMDCYGSGNLSRFACMIAGFAISLEISTYAAIVSGQFAKAHEKLGRNKPIDWLTKSELKQPFIENCLNGSFEGKTIHSILLENIGTLDNGILTNLTSRVSKKLIGFFPFEIDYYDENLGQRHKLPLLIKSKPLDTEVFKGLHFMAAAINPELSDLINEHKEFLEYKNCHVKEISLFNLLKQHSLDFSPKMFGQHNDEKREIHLFIQEMLLEENLLLYNTENQPGRWENNHLEKVIAAIAEIHKTFQNKNIQANHPEITVFCPWNAKALYKKLLTLCFEELQKPAQHKQLNLLLNLVDGLEQEHGLIQVEKTIIHNDFNPRNTAIRNDGSPCFYDWELSVLNFPQRDIVEFLCFALEENFSEEKLFGLLNFHYAFYADSYSRAQWFKAYTFALKEFLITR
ncbi:MAG: phosphotransferase, partial [Bacteroidetes bacterium]|nr:phosphotransferase [Bacteroidota bacterium]